MELVIDPEVKAIFEGYPPKLAAKLKMLRMLILDTANTEGLEKLVETKKWGEPSYLTRHGSTMRLGSVKNNPKQYALYFICTTSLVATFRMVYGDQLQFDGNRAILLNIEDDIPTAPLKHCISLALNYHKIKDLPMLGV